ncbi:hypothetical protein [Mariniblastus fucicola]|uniref:Uncharacterized protein n=1 Tax=Mariniblastus fucicola TaxID=980251 RepID=A0A5B9P8H6_9BACT|nr:hypothetical protein [Mariniblastus fucicola]QEG21212.1 hypothetical protein MFFC18_10670 [Mariniblastus fucicola]
MQLDRTFIGIRQRSALEVWDLTLLVIRRYFRPLCWLFLIGAIPWMILNHLMTMWMVSDDYFSDHVQWFYWINACLVVSQAQAGTFWIAHYLGQAMFNPNPQAMETVSAVRKSKHRFFFGWLHLVNRMVLPALGLVAILWFSEEDEVNALLAAFVLPMLVFIGLVVRARTPYLSEILLLEEAPRKSDSTRVQSYSSRSKNLLGAPGADFFVKFSLAAIVGVGLSLAIYESFCLLDSVLGLQSIASSNLNYIYWQFSLWIAAAIVAVNRFLSYIDLRIRTEGWAVRLRLMAEEKRMAAEA